jgi:hypothetical protein
MGALAQYEITISQRSIPAKHCFESLQQRHASMQAAHKERDEAALVKTGHTFANETHASQAEDSCRFLKAATARLIRSRFFRSRTA